MSTTASEFLTTAKTSLTNDNECDTRNAASRAYYAMYHRVLDLLTQTIPHYSGGGVHHSLVVHLQTAGNGEPFSSLQQRRLAYMLRQSKEIRSQADYDITTDFEKVRAEDQVNRAESVLELCEQLQSQAA